MRKFAPTTLAAAIIAGVGSMAVVSSPLIASDQAMSQPASVQFGQGFIDVQANVDFQTATLRIAGPRGYALTRQLSAEDGQFITADLMLDAEPVRRGGNVELQPRENVPDGMYRYEVEFHAADGSVKVTHGAFRVEGGNAYEIQSGSDNVNPDGSISSVEDGGVIGRMAGTVVDFVFPSAHATTNVDNILQIQDEADDGQSRIFFESDLTDTPPSNWWLYNQDGNMFFREFPGTGNTDHVALLAGGDFGIGTTSPQDALHVNDSGGFQIRMGSGGTTTRFDAFGGRFAIYGNNPTQFSVNSDAPFGSMSIDGAGDVGLGIFSPNAALHVSRSDNSANVRVEDTGGGSPQVMFQLLNNGFPQFNMQDTSQTDVSWSFRLSGTAGSTERFTITKVGTGGAEFELFADGSATFAGPVTADGVLLTSTREAKTDFRAIDERDVLDKLASLEISEWRYKDEAEGTTHIGPIAEEFHEVFGLSDGKRLNMIDTNGIAFAAIQALHAENQDLKERLAVLERQLTD